MKFSICIPNYNYGHYIRSTICSILPQDVELEVLVADNASTDNSVAVIEAINDPRINLTRNNCNVGFSANLDRACQSATGDRLILLSSDDLAGPDALTLYDQLARALGERAKHSIFASDQYIIDSESRIIGTTGRNNRLWQDATKHEALSKELGRTVFHVPANVLLKRALMHLRTPFSFATTCYSREMYDRVEGYGSGALINPDKKFAWKILSVASDVFYIDSPLFSYRVHAANQNSQQEKSGALKHLMDQYRATFDTDHKVLLAAGVDRENLEQSFIYHDVALRGLKALAQGNRDLAQRHLDFGRATYPKITARSRLIYILRVALALGPFGTLIAHRRFKSALLKYQVGGDSVDRSGTKND